MKKGIKREGIQPRESAYHRGQYRVGAVKVLAEAGLPPKYAGQTQPTSDAVRPVQGRSGFPVAQVPCRVWRAVRRPLSSVETRDLNQVGPPHVSERSAGRVSRRARTGAGRRTVRHRWDHAQSGSIRARGHCAASQADKPRISVTTPPSAPVIRARTRWVGSPLSMSWARWRAPRNSAM